MKNLLGYLTLLVFMALQTSYALAEYPAGNAYIGAGIGQSTVDLCDDAEDFGATSCDDEDVGFKFLAGYNFNKNVALEGEYVDFGEVTADFGAVDLDIEATGFAFALKGTAPISEDFGIFGKVGVVFWEAEASVSGFGTLDDDGKDVALGIGAGYTVNPKIDFRVEWERFDFDDTDVDLLSASLIINFN